MKEIIIRRVELGVSSESFSKWNISILTVDYVSIARLSISFLKRVYP